ncbi:hypothetical protein [Novosphingobium album (ex Liu et al. 2023)]|uniref:DUF1570 domain-containing protein n=1 Tax=Novosphingobium album (ex Liu et al. 2023) TaxID=3031130 RepID=A0ABT5WW21_9SPHN|nr:hypothetical protein [Novosphingobium album (ex Liu et al. 2023)]MDE8654105.1 hypothetical protein [Novosphingobium album (ex Liu et al. 2023)]
MLRPAFRFLLALAALLACAVPAHAAGWYRATTAEFIIYSEGDPADLRAFAENLERFDAVLRERFAIRAEPRPNPLTIYLLAKAGSVSRLLDRDHVAGFYSPVSEGSFAIANRAADRGGKRLSGQMTLFHEYTHHFMYRHLTAPWPAWYREGLAEYLSTVTFAPDGSWTMGTPPGRRLRRARGAAAPLAPMLAGEMPAKATKDPRDFYARAWLLAHMLESDPARSAALKTYLAAIAAGEAPGAAAARLGSPAALDRAFAAYAARPLPVTPSPGPVAPPAPPEITALDGPASALVELELARRTGRDAEATRAALAGLATRFPNDPAVLYQLALAERARDGGAIAAEALADRLVALAPDHARGHLLRADLLAARGAPRDTILDELARAARLGPDDPYIAVTRYRIMTRLGVPPTPELFASIAHAFALAPESSEVRLAHAFALAAQRRFDEAEAVAKVMAYDPHGGDVGRKALETIGNMRRLFANAPERPN